MHIKTVGNILIIMGILILLASLFADEIGIGGSPDFGPDQIIGLIFGPVISFVGFNVRAQSD